MPHNITKLSVTSCEDDERVRHSPVLKGKLMKKYTVYCHINKLNGKKYVGITGQKVENRWRNGNGYQGQVFYNAILRYGWHNFYHEILYSGLTKHQAEQMEIKLISEWKTNDARYGYNASSGGESGNGGARCSEKRRVKMSNRMKGSKNPMFGKKGGMNGKKLTPEQRAKISKGNKGKKRSDKTLKEMSARASLAVKCSDGRIFMSRKQCATALGCCVDTVIKHIKSGEPFKGLILSNIDKES